MARAKKPEVEQEDEVKPTKANKPGKQVATWDEELAKLAQESATMEESTSTGSFFSLKSGVLSLNDNAFPNNEMAVIILDTVLENVFYKDGYDPEAVTAPSCFAFGRSEDEMEPHLIVKSAELNPAETCAQCPNNEWGSADVGRGKACSNRRRLAMIPAGTFDKQGNFVAFEDPEDFEASLVAFMKLPVTSVKGYASYVKQIASALRMPPLGVFTKVSVRPDTGSVFKVHFEALGQVPSELLSVIMERRQFAVDTIEAPYSAYEEPEEKPAKGRGSNKAKAPPAKAAGKRGARY